MQPDAPRRRSALDRLKVRPECPDGVVVGVGFLMIVGVFCLPLSVVSMLFLADGLFRRGFALGPLDVGVMALGLGFGLTTAAGFASFVGVRRRKKWAWAVAAVQLGLLAAAFLTGFVVAVAALATDPSGSVGAAVVLGVLALIVGAMHLFLLASRRKYAVYCAGRWEPS